ncbi:MAG: rhodanese-like domain-containing protein [Fidelibacterota bacterium]
MRRIDILFFLLIVVSCTTSQTTNEVSGEIYKGYRVLTVPATMENVKFTVYRGDYVKFVNSGKADKIHIVIPALDIEQSFTGDVNIDPYIKLKRAGNYKLRINDHPGRIKVLNYEEGYYTELSAAESWQFIQEKSPFILDVRTPREYASGHLSNANLIPVQFLQERLDEIADNKDQDILVYCRSGNRSTVASKILIDAGFRHVFNLRSGIRGWQNGQFPIER